MKIRSRIFLRLATGVGALLLCAAISQAEDGGQYRQAPKAIKTWIEHLSDRSGYRCCDTADAAVPDAWKIGQKHYRVKIYGMWLIVPDAAVVKGRNRLGHAMVWLENTGDAVEASLAVRCFLPGPQF